MARQRVVIEGDKKLQKELDKIVGGLDDLREVGTGAAALIAQRAEQQAPVASGSLRDDIRTFAAKRNAGIRVGRKSKPHAGPVIGGHGGPGATRPQGGWIRPNPFPFDAADDRRSAVIDTYETFVDELVAGKRPRAAQRYRTHEDE